MPPAPTRPPLDNPWVSPVIFYGTSEKLAAETSLISEDMITTAANQHLAIIQSLRDGNVQQIKSVIKIHLDDSKERLILKIDKNGGII